MRALGLLAGAALISCNVWALSPDVTLNAITPIEGTKDMLIQFTSDNGAKYQYKDNDGMATIISVNYMISWERQVALDEDEWDDIKGADAAYYETARPLLIAQIHRLSENYKTWAKGETDNELAGSYEANAEGLDKWEKLFTEKTKVTNEEMSDFTSFIERFAGNHSYEMSTNGEEYRPSQRIFGSGGGEIATHHAGIDSMCKSATNGDLEAIVKGALGSATSNNEWKGKGGEPSHGAR